MDTNVISDWLQGALPIHHWLEEHRDEVAISSLTLAEMMRGIEAKADSKARRQLERDYRFILEDFGGAIWVFDEAAAAEWGRLLAQAEGRRHPLPLMDSHIGAIARCMGAQVVSRDGAGFSGCLRVDPWTGLEYRAWQD